MASAEILDRAFSPLALVIVANPGRCPGLGYGRAFGPKRWLLSEIGLIGIAGTSKMQGSLHYVLRALVEMTSLVVGWSVAVIQNTGLSTTPNGKAVWLRSR